ncbi:hypothetical protein O6H91_21G012300 [Diphasiastrum complanatum]|uniref:Uncharacterized protein n=1 Tax=Diphasiastrum complanatum TaxID=34168 RepID=A0ACC2AHU9_DIPCM|nr:hypothetical protein O6H91_21G012300 [Diphasiastrum complanatum]
MSVMEVQRMQSDIWIRCLRVLILLGSSHLQSSYADRILPADSRRLAGAGNLTTCLATAKARTAFPGDPEYERTRTYVFNHRYQYAPAAFVFPTTVAQVQNAVFCAVKLRIGIAPRGGGHSFEDYSLGGRDGAIVVDMTAFTDISYNKAAGTVTVGSGFRLAPLKLALWNVGKVTVPCGTCPTIGVGGHALGGGWGFKSRKFGILSDNIVEAQMVTANASVVTANAIENADLLWALKGAGANSFGIVTQFTFTVHDVSAPITHFSYDFPQSRQAETLKAFQIWGQGAVAEVTASLYLDPSGGNSLSGDYLGPSTDLNAVLKTFMDKAPASSKQTIMETDFITNVLIESGFSQDANPSVLNLQNYTYPTVTFKAKSILLHAPGLCDDGIKTFISTLQAGSSTIGYVLVDLFGGSASVINQIPPEDCAWVHRNTLFNIQMFTSWQNNNISQAHKDITSINKLWRAVRAYTSGSEAYQNYIDRDMPLSAYYGSNLERLITEKKKWDSQNVFHFPQSIPVR